MFSTFVTLFGFGAMMTYVEILPVGLGVTLISSVILKRKSAKNKNISTRKVAEPIINN